MRRRRLKPQESNRHDLLNHCNDRLSRAAGRHGVCHFRFRQSSPQETRTQTQAGIIRIFAQKLGGIMPFWYAMGLVLLIVDSLLLRRTSEFALVIAASAIWAVVIVPGIAIAL
jgi:hypothetical protein